MTLFKEFSILIAFYLLGEGISLLLPFSFPGSIIGMGLLFLALLMKIITLKDIGVVSGFLLKYMPLFFIPAGVSVMSSVPLIEDHILTITLTLVLSAVFMLALIALIVDYLVKKVKDA